MMKYLANTAVYDAKTLSWLRPVLSKTTVQPSLHSCYLPLLHVKYHNTIDLMVAQRNVKESPEDVVTSDLLPFCYTEELYYERCNWANPCREMTRLSRCRWMCSKRWESEAGHSLHTSESVVKLTPEHPDLAFQDDVCCHERTLLLLLRWLLWM